MELFGMFVPFVAFVMVGVFCMNCVSFIFLFMKLCMMMVKSINIFNNTHINWESYKHVMHPWEYNRYSLSRLYFYCYSNKSMSLLGHFPLVRAFWLYFQFRFKFIVIANLLGLIFKLISVVFGIPVAYFISFKLILIFFILFILSEEDLLLMYYYITFFVYNLMSFCLWGVPLFLIIYFLFLVYFWVFSQFVSLSFVSFFMTVLLFCYLLLGSLVFGNSLPLFGLIFFHSFVTITILFLLSPFESVVSKKGFEYLIVKSLLLFMEMGNMYSLPELLLFYYFIIICKADRVILDSLYVEYLQDFYFIYNSILFLMNLFLSLVCIIILLLVYS